MAAQTLSNYPVAASAAATSTARVAALNNTRRRSLPALMLGTFATLTMLGGCTCDIRCSDKVVIDALHRSLDQLYAEFRQVADVEWEIRDLIAVEQTPRRSVCKAVARISVTFAGSKQQEDTAIIFYAEATEKGDVVVTVPTPNRPKQ
ncbi:hypothetical protein [Methylobacterium sp. SI9]|uniref:hypothetical protein n=1 Tax=Methylobacterium guangdongense TaxID=3138811 RepID=UPI00313AC9A5